MLKVRQITFRRLFSTSLPIFLGIGLGFWVARGNWLYALALTALAPLAILFSANPFIGVILWLLLMPLSSAMPNPDLMWWVIHRILVVFTLCMAILPYLLNPSRLPRLRLGLPEVSIALLAAYIPISLLLSGTALNDPMRKYLDRMLIPFCMYLVLRITPLDQRFLKPLQWTAFAVAIIQSAIGFTSWVMPQLLPKAWHYLVGYRTVGSLGQPAVFTSIVIFCAVILFYAAMQLKNDFVRLMFLVMGGICFIDVFISLERASWVAGSLVLIGLLVLYRDRLLRFLLVFAVCVATVGGGFLLKYVPLAIQRLSEQKHVDNRIVLMYAMFQMFQIKPIFGWGYDTLNQNIMDYYRQVGSAYINSYSALLTSHNTYLTIIAELGLVGFLLYFIPTIWLFFASLRAWREKPQMEPSRRFLLAVLWLGALHNFIVSNSIDMRFLPIGLMIWWIIMGLIANLLNQHAEVRDKLYSNRTALERFQGQPFDSPKILS